MSNSKKIVSIAFAGAAVAATTTFTATGRATAAPAVSCKIKASGVCYRGPLKAKNSGNMVFVDTTKNNTLTCRKAFMSGVVSTSQPHSVTGVYGYMKKSVTKFSSCTGPFGLTFKAHLIDSPKLFVSGTGTSSTIDYKISGTGLAAACRATLSAGALPGRYINSKHEYDVNSGHLATFTVKSAANCLGAIATGDAVYFAGIYKVSTPANFTIS